LKRNVPRAHGLVVRTPPSQMLQAKFIQGVEIGGSPRFDPGWAHHPNSESRLSLRGCKPSESDVLMIFVDSGRLSHADGIGDIVIKSR